MKLFSWIKNKLKREKKEEEQETTPYGLPLEEEEVDSSLVKVEKRIVGVKKTFESMKMPRSLNFGIFMRLKRILASILFFVYIITSIMVFPNTFVLFFLGTALIMLDYLLKTRRAQWGREA